MHLRNFKMENLQRRNAVGSAPESFAAPDITRADGCFLSGALCSNAWVVSENTRRRKLLAIQGLGRPGANLRGRFELAVLRLLLQRGNSWS
jgi:hypothetical protein